MRQILVGASLAFLLVGTAMALDITTPGVTVPTGQTGVLQADLSCAPVTIGVYLENGAKLDLNGHTLDGCAVGRAGVSPVRMKVYGPGTIKHAGVVLQGGKLIISDVTIQDAPSWSIYGDRDVFNPPSFVKAKRVTITGNATFSHIRATKVSAQDVSVDGGASVGIEAGSFSGKRVQVTNNGANGIESSGGPLRASDLTVTGNACGGIAGLKVTVRDGTITGNLSGAPGCVDVYSGYPPKLVRVTCDKSSDTNLPSTTWGVCALD
jgi:hypothetical protein